MAYAQNNLTKPWEWAYAQNNYKIICHAIFAAAREKKTKAQHCTPNDIVQYQHQFNLEERAAYAQSLIYRENVIHHSIIPKASANKKVNKNHNIIPMP